jgi:peptidoglycan/xylan/chitin deacetylase (PgdA/CDA1 family)
MNIPILLYHHLIAGDHADRRFYELSISQFEEQLDLLKRFEFETITFASLMRMLDNTEAARPRMAIITFDDAFCSFRELALPALQRRGMHATLFVPAGHLGGTNSWDAARGFPERPIMNEEELRSVAKAGIEIGSHGWHHRSLPMCNDSELEEEVLRSREKLSSLVSTVDYFAYPGGEYSPRSCAIVERAGYAAAASIFSGERSVTANRFAMRRVYIHPGDTSLRFRIKLSDIYLRYKAFRGLPTPSSSVPQLAKVA